MAIEILLMGLDEINASIGLALAEAKVEATRVGYDPIRERANAALKIGAVDRIVLKPTKVAGTADLVILSLPTDEAHETLESLGQKLKPGALLLDLCSLKSHGLAWAAESLPEGRHYVAATPVIASLEASAGAQPSPDLLREGVFALVIPPDTPENVFNFTNELVETVGANPFFVEAYEADAALVASDGLPALLATALTRAVVGSPGWRELQRLAGRAYADKAYLSQTQTNRALGAILTHNRETTLARMDAILAELRMLRELIAQGETEKLIDLFVDADETHNTWLSARARGDLGMPDFKPPDLPRHNPFQRFFGFGPRTEQENP